MILYQDSPTGCFWTLRDGFWRPVVSKNNLLESAGSILCHALSSWVDC